ncbi:MAG: UDP-N-acetylmuramoyl-tripeptide--D-alanyl-D-alanine ligase [Treponema sp.]|nr:UDP-N-acetylmuramoyl-tripeptide--D-alanyl-D-alanine ligase [Treponema sp.]
MANARPRPSAEPTAENPPPAPLFDAAGAAAIVGAELVGDPRSELRSVVADSRQAAAGALFVALPGEKTDGHAYVEAALAAGASCVLARSDRRAQAEAAWAAAGRRGTLLFVPDTLRALQLLAREHRRRFPALFRVGITGSSGKTTTKECAAAAIGRGRSVVFNQGNLNSDIGLSLSVFSMGAGHEVAVFEMGMNRRGEMGELAEVYEPDLALITNIGTAHIGILGSREEIAKEKKQIFSRFDGRQEGLVWEDDAYKAFLKEGVRGRVSEFGSRTTKGFRGAVDMGLDGFDVDWEGLTFRFPLAGRHNLLDAIAAMALAQRVGTPVEDVAAGLESVRPLFGRSEILRGEFTIVRDCYNANPDSVEAAMGLCDSLAWRGRRLYVLGSMLELGASSAAEHARVGKAAGRSSADALFFFGEETRLAFEAARASGFRGLLVHETDFDRLRDTARAWLRPGDLVLLKASRGMELERLAESLIPGAPARH